MIQNSMIIRANNHLHDACNRYFVNCKIKYFVRVRNRFSFWHGKLRLNANRLDGNKCCFWVHSNFANHFTESIEHFECSDWLGSKEIKPKLTHQNAIIRFISIFFGSTALAYICHFSRWIFCVLPHRSCKGSYICISYLSNYSKN